MTEIKHKIKIAVVGDIHDQWNKDDEAALKHLGVDLVLFVGDFGNEAVDIVRQIASVSLPKAAIAGNHDAWYTASSWGQKQAPYDRRKEDRVKQQLDLLGETHVGFSKLDFPQFNLSVVGSRPFSWGGQTWRNEKFYRDRYNIKDFQESTTRIVEAVRETSYDTIIFIGHNGPYGLGDAPEAICGRDWKPTGGDYGDPDLTAALEKSRILGKSVPLVTFGHMHHRLRHRQDRQRTIICTDKAETIYLNAACVPRIHKVGGQIQRNFSLVSLENGTVSQISLVWLDREFNIQSADLLYAKSN